MKADVSPQRIRVVHVDTIGSDIEVSHPEHGVIGLEVPIEVVEQSVKPRQLVLELVGIRQVTLGDVGVDNVYAADFSFDKSRFVFGLVIETPPDASGLGLAQNGDAVVAFLTFEDVTVSNAVKWVCGEVWILYLGFLDTEDIGPALFEPCKHYRQPHP